jgi:hypothetical protein
MLGSLAEFDEITAELDVNQPHPGAAAEGPRGRAGSPKNVSLPEGWLNGHDIDDEAAAMIQAAELSVSGG